MKIIFTKQNIHLETLSRPIFIFFLRSSFETQSLWVVKRMAGCVRGKLIGEEMNYIALHVRMIWSVAE